MACPTSGSGIGETSCVNDTARIRRLNAGQFDAEAYDREAPARVQASLY